MSTTTTISPLTSHLTTMDSGQRYAHCYGRLSGIFMILDGIVRAHENTGTKISPESILHYINEYKQVDDSLHTATDIVIRNGIHTV